MWLTVLSLLIVSIYVAVMIKNHGIPYSISATYYRTYHKWTFCLSMILTGGLILPGALEVTPDYYQFLIFLACAGIILVGTSPNFREKTEKKIHTVGATMCLLFSQIWVGVINYWVLLVWLPYVIYTLYKLYKNKELPFYSAFISTKPLFWVEVTALVGTYITLFLLW